jgi:hypothetical protein
MEDAEKFALDKLDGIIALVQNSTGNYIDLVQVNDRVFRTKIKLMMNTDFKVEIRNFKECYVYIFGKETDGSS